MQERMREAQRLELEWVLREFESRMDMFMRRLSALDSGVSGSQQTHPQLRPSASTSFDPDYDAALDDQPLPDRDLPPHRRHGT